MLRLSLRDCRLELEFSFFALLAFCCLFAGVSSGAFLFLAAALHEFSHLTALFLLHAPPKTVRLSALGCRIVLDPERRLSYRGNALVSLMGPMANLLSFGTMAALGRHDHIFAAASLTLGLFHCLPIEPLDGGLALRAVLSCRMPGDRAGKITFFLSLVFLIPLAVLGFLVLLRTRYNFSLLAMSIYLMLYLVLKRDYLAD